MAQHPIEAGAFPARLAADAAAVAAAISIGQSHAHLDSFAVDVLGERLAIPVRVYYERAQVFQCAGMPADQGLIALCLGSRHHDGTVREKCVRRLLSVDEPWAVPFVAPFVVQLVGEYVIEIIRCIEDALPALNAQAYGRYLNDNPALAETTGRRVVSYWNEYHRKAHPRLDDYPGTRVFNALRAMAARWAAQQAASAATVRP